MAPFVPQDFKDLIADVTSSLCDKFINTLLRLPVLVADLVAYLFDDDGNFTPEVVNQILPSGLIMLSGLASPPTGWLVCNGDAVSRTTYANLFSAIGETFGAGNGSTTFNVPDLRDKFARGASATNTLTTAGGAEDFALSLDHKHAVGQFDHPGGDEKYLIINNDLTIQGATQTREESGEGSTNDVQAYEDISPAPASDIIATEKQEYDAGETLTVDTVPPFLSLHYLIKT